MTEETEEEREHPNERLENMEVENARNLIDEAREQADRIEAANKESKSIAERLEAAKIRQALGGTTEAGIITPPPKEETPQEYAKRILKGELKNEEK